MSNMEQKISRRSFFKATATLGAGALGLPVFGAAALGPVFRSGGSIS